MHGNEGINVITASDLHFPLSTSITSGMPMFSFSLLVFIQNLTSFAPSALSRHFRVERMVASENIKPHILILRRHEVMQELLVYPAVPRYTLTNCSVSAEGIPTHCSGYNYTHEAYQGRTEFFPGNASLLLQNLQLSDSGVYSVTFKVPQQTRNITLTVSESHLNHGNADDGTRKETGNEPNPFPDLLLGLQITGGFSFLLLLLLLFFCCREHKGAVQQRRTRIIKQQEEVPNHEESHMESSLPMTVSTIYARIGEDTGQRQRRSESQTEYASISFS
ncbi:hypothetical protein KIL84_023100 [Mauremys mutica]|uniref:Uncharacterized protein n=1 Tax=Mauremys mutica TaxID=74926 RepID=A0A9D4AR75_9SAUR|nr:hypothetical protein KIL84_023100 [Mauremys mutica]